MSRLLTGAAIVAGAYVGLLSAGDLDHSRGLLAAVVLPFWLICGATTIWATRGRSPLRRPVITMALLAMAVQLPGVLTPPHSSSDAWRYVWDGRVQLSGTSPYRYVPLDDRLAALRDPILFPGLAPNRLSGVTTTPLPTDRVELLARAEADSRTVINRPRVPTIYPPLAQLWFAAVALLTPWSLGSLGLQIASALLAIAVTAALAALLLRRGRDPRGALWWAWCPTVILETGNGAHVDILAAAFVLGAVVVVTTRPGRTVSAWVAGLLVGAAAAVKLTPLVLLPALIPLRNNGFRRSWQVPGAAFGTLVTAYAPHVLVAGGLVLGYLPGYLSEEGGRNRGGLLRLVVPDRLLTAIMLVTMGAVTLWAVRATRVECPQHAALVLFGSLLLVTTPSYPWYALPLVVLAVLARRLEWLAVPVAGYIAYAGARVPPVGAVGYGLAAAVVIGVAAWRHHRAAPPCWRRLHTNNDDLPERPPRPGRAAHRFTEWPDDHRAARSHHPRRWAPISGMPHLRRRPAVNVSPAARHGQLPIEPRPPFPPLSMDTATAKVPAAEDVWNTRDPDWVSRAFTVDSIWRNGDVFLQGREDERGPDHEIPLQ